MANPTYTPNYNLVKPDPNDFYDVNQFNSNADIIDSELKKISDSAGNLTNLNTEQKADLVDAINELLAKIGNTTSLTTDEKSNLVAAVNEIKQQITAHLADDVKHITQEERELWNKSWNADNDGSGSGLDADTLDGYHANKLTKIVSSLSDIGLSDSDMSGTDFESNVSKIINASPDYSTVLLWCDDSINSIIKQSINAIDSTVINCLLRIDVVTNSDIPNVIYVYPNNSGRILYAIYDNELRNAFIEIGGNAMEEYTKPRGEGVSIWGHLNEEMTYFDIQGEGVLTSITSQKGSANTHKFTLSVDGGTPFLIIDTENDVGTGGLVTSDNDYKSWIGTIFFKESLVIKGTNTSSSNSTITLNISYTMK